MKNKKQSNIPSSTSNLHNSQDKTYNRDTAKLGLEKYLMESVKGFFDQTIQSVNAKNGEHSKVNLNHQTGDNALKNMKYLEQKTRTLLTKIQGSPKLSATKKKQFTSILSSTQTVSK